MARKRKTELEEERMTDSNLSRVIRLLEPEEGKKPITKEDACQMLGMAYNTTRLGTIIEQFKERQRRTAEQRAKLRGKAVTKDEKIFIIQEYLTGATIDSITKTVSPKDVEENLKYHKGMTEVFLVRPDLINR